MSHTSDAMCFGFVSVVIEPADYDEDGNVANPPVIEQVRYDQFVRRLFKVDTFKEMAHHAKGGVCEEAGELSSWIKHHLTYNESLMKVIEKEGKSQTLYQCIIEELGDIRFYLQAVQQLYNISEQMILQHNADKLGKRYKKLAYTDEAAQDRADKKDV